MEEGKLHVRLGRSALGGMLLLLVLVLAACGGGGRHARPGHRPLFESDRRADHTPAIEAVEDRAYPRTYVETRRALAGRRAAARARTRAAVRRSRSKLRAAAASWQEAGPFTP